VKRRLKRFFGKLPFAPEIYWRLRQYGKPTGGFAFQKLSKAIPEWRKVGLNNLAQNKPPRGKKIFLFATLRYWIEHATLVGMALGALGNEVTLAFLPYANWQKPIDEFDLRRQNMFVRYVLSQAEPLIKVVPLLSTMNLDQHLPEALQKEIEDAALQDAQYTQQVEEINRNGKLYRLRLERNLQAAAAALAWMKKNKPDVVILPSGSILEFGAVFHAARSLSLPVVTYEFGEQRQRIWLSLNQPVMRQNTDELWQVFRDRPLTAEQRERIQNLYAARMKANLWENFARQWQGVPNVGGDQVRADLGLDERPVVLLAANVIGDSLTLGRQVFTDSMTEWLVKTAQLFAQRDDIQCIIRIHPGERYTSGPSVAEIFKNALKGERSFPQHIHLIAADAPFNTYDLIQIADLGLVYTTTVGLELALSGVPVIVVGNTHYRGRGFTFDPSSWEDYERMLFSVLNEPDRYRLSAEQVELAWRYAYRFFFNYPLPFPWHLWHFWLDVKEFPLERVLSEECKAIYEESFRCLCGESRHWSEEA